MMATSTGQLQLGILGTAVIFERGSFRHSSFLEPKALVVIPFAARHNASASCANFSATGSASFAALAFASSWRSRLIRCSRRHKVVRRVTQHAIVATFQGLLRRLQQFRPWRGSGVLANAAASMPQDICVPYGMSVPRSADYEDADDAADSPVDCFEDALQEGFACPARLRGRKVDVVEEVNLWHYSMLNDIGRNEFFWDSLKLEVLGKRVLDLGTGSGLLAMMAAKLGAESVIALEASGDLADIARINILRNALEEKVQVVHALSTEVSCALEDRVNVIVTETFGTLLNGENVLDYVADARDRLAIPNVRIIPSGGAQHCVLVMSPTIERMSSASRVGEGSCHGLDLSAMDVLRDTAQVVSANLWGLRLRELQDLTLMSRRVELFELDFAQSRREDIPDTHEFEVAVLWDGTIDAVVCTWEVWSDTDRTRILSTHLEATCDGEASLRDAHFSQALQLIAEEADSDDGDVQKQTAVAPRPFEVKAGERLILRVLHNSARSNMQFSLRRSKGPT